MINNRTATISENQTGVSEDERLRYLQQLQEETTLSMVPAMTFLLVLGAVGLVGNTAVLFVYTCKLRTNSIRVLIRAIAMFDLVANVCVIPAEIYDMFHTWDFDNRGLCRARMFVTAFVTLSTGLALLVVAVVRYRKVCHPYRWQITVTQAKIISVIIAFIGALVATPYAIINGRQTKSTPRSDITGYECASDDEYKDTHWPVVNNAFFFLLFLLSCVPLTVLYVRIGTAAKKHDKIIGTAATFSQEPPNISYPDVADPKFQRSDEKLASPDYMDTEFQRSNEEIICSDCNVKTQRSSEEIASPDCIDSKFLSDEKLASPDYMDPEFKKSDEKLASPDYIDPEFQRSNKEIISEDCNVKTQRSSVERDKTSNLAVNSVGSNRKSLLAVNTNSDHRTKLAYSGVSHDLIVQVQAGSKDVQADEIQIVTQTVSGCERYVTSESASESDSCKDVYPSSKQIQLRSFASQALDDHHFQALKDDLNSSDEKCDPVNRSFKEQGGSMVKLQSTNLPFTSITPVLQQCRKRYSFKEGLSGHADKCEYNRNINLSRNRNSGHIEKLQFETSDDCNDLREKSRRCRQFCKAWKLHEVPRIYHESPEVVLVAASTKEDGDFISRSEDDRENTCVQSSLSGKHNMSSATSNDPRKSTLEPPFAKSAPVEASILNCKQHQEYQNCDIDGNNSNNNMAVEVSTKRTDNSTYNFNQERNSSFQKNTQITQLFDRLKRFTNKESDKCEKPHNNRRPLGRMNAMLIIISAVFVVGFLPYLALSFFEFIAPDEYNSLSLRELAAYNLFLRFYLLNSAVNPIIYSLCAVNFRKQCLKFFKLRTKV